MATRALVIQDDLGLARVLRLCLQHHGIAAEIAETGEEGLDIASRERFDVILVDDVLGDLSGYEVTRMLRLGAVAAPVIFVSAMARDPEIQDIARHAGVNALLAVPFSPTSFERALAEVLPRYRGFGPWPTAE